MGQGQETTNSGLTLFYSGYPEVFTKEYGQHYCAIVR